MIFLVIVVKTIKRRMLALICAVFLILSCVILLQFNYIQIAQSLCYAKLTRVEREQPWEVYKDQGAIRPRTYRQCRADIRLFDVFKRTYTKDELTEVPW